MKLLFKSLSIAVLAFGMAISMTSCSDDCDDVTCQNGGTCDEGVCDCPAGFSGDECEVEDLCITQSVTCENGGTCGDGICDCTQGWEGTGCADVARDKFIGNYTVDESCSSSGSVIYPMGITMSTANNFTMVLGGIYDDFFNNVVTAEIDDAGPGAAAQLFTIPLQDPDNDGFTIEGNGSIAADGSISMSFTVTDNGVTPATQDICTSSGTPQ